MSNASNVESAFSKLLSSQLELLDSMNQQRKCHASQVLGQQQLWPTNSTPLHLENTWEESMIRPHYGFSRRSSLDMIMSRRLSLGSMGFDGKDVCCFGDMNEGRVLLDNDFSLFSPEDFESDWHDHGASTSKKRRLSQCGSSIYVVHDSVPLPPSSPELILSGEQDTTHKDTRSNDKGPQRVSPGCESNETRIVNVEREKLAELWKWVDSKALQAFQTAMTHSEVSRRDIHKFDCAMDHKLLLLSTMNKSSTSHKQLRVILPPAATDSK